MTITPRISVTATDTITPTITFTPPTSAEDLDLRKRNNQPIPTYVSAFPSSEISSACSCLSITPSTTIVKTTSTVVVPAPTITIKTTVIKPPVTTTVSTITVTASTTVTECGMPQPTFILKLGTSVLLNGTQLKGTYGIIDIVYDAFNTRTDRFAFNGLTDPSGAGYLYLLLPPRYLVSEETGRAAYRINGETGVQLFHFEDPYFAAAGGDVPATCSIAGGVLECVSGDATILQLCPGLEVTTNDLYIGPTVGSGCVEVVLDVLQACVPPPGTP